MHWSLPRQHLKTSLLDSDQILTYSAGCHVNVNVSDRTTLALSSAISAEILKFLFCFDTEDRQINALACSYDFYDLKLLFHMLCFLFWL